MIIRLANGWSIRGADGGNWQVWPPRALAGTDVHGEPSPKLVDCLEQALGRGLLVESDRTAGLRLRQMIPAIEAMASTACAAQQLARGDAIAFGGEHAIIQRPDGQLGRLARSGRYDAAPSAAHRRTD